MKRITLFLFLSAVSVYAQRVEKAVVPLSDPGRPARVHAALMMGGITVQGYDGKEVLVESHPRPEGDPHRTQTAAGSMRRLEMPGNAGLDIDEENNVVNIRTGWTKAVDLVISVPRRTSLELKCLNGGDISVEHVEGEIDADNLNGKVILKNVSGSAIAHSLNGSVVVTFDRVDGSKPMSFSTMNGDIDVSLPAGTNANLSMKTDQGEIFSDFDVKITSGGEVKPEPARSKDGAFRLHFDRTLHGKLNGGGPDYQFTSFRGQIFIRKK